MPKITKIVDKPERERVWIYIDYQYCTSVRERTFVSLGLRVGDEITCEQVKEKENFAFKNAYANTWAREAEKIEQFSEYIYKIFPGKVEITTKGLGTGSKEFVGRHANEDEKVDLIIRKVDTTSPNFGIELTGTDQEKLSTYWVRPDKIEHIQQHPSEIIWIVLMYSDKMIYIRPELNKSYSHVVKNIRGIDEHYVIFKDSDIEVKSEGEFIESLKANLGL